MVIVSAVVLALPVFAGVDNSQSQGGRTAPANSSQQSQPQADAEEASSASVSGVIKGTVISADPAAGSLTVNESATGADRKFTAKKEDLSNIKIGDKVNVTTQPNNSTMAQRIEKDKL